MTAATTTTTAQSAAAPRAVPARVVDVGAALGAAWLVFGVYLDGWAHSALLPDSFWTPWHAVLYSGYAALALFLAIVVGAGARAGLALPRAVPDGYAPSLLGAAIFGAGGAFDMLWHTLIGIERGLDTLFSPSHLMLAIGMVLLVSGPLRSVWRRGAVTRLSLDALVAFASMAMLFLILSFMFQFAQPFIRLMGHVGERGLGELGQMRALLGVFAFTAPLVALTLLGIRERALLPGSVTALLLLDAAAMMAMRGTTSETQMAVSHSSAIAAGLVGDVLLWRIRSSPAPIVLIRVFAAAVPAVFFAWYFGAVALRVGTWWTPHALTGMTVLGALAGLLLSYLIFPRAGTPPRVA